MPAIDWITVQGFKSLRDIEKLPLNDVNVIIGSNGSGKSNFINVFSLLNSIRGGRLQEYVATNGGASSLLYMGPKETSKISIHIAFSNEKNQYKIDLSYSDGDILKPTLESVFYWDKSKYNYPYDTSLVARDGEAGISAQSNHAIASYVQNHLQKWRVYHFHDTSRTSPMKQNCDVGDNRFLRADGSNLASFIYLLKNEHPDCYNIIRASIKRVAPFFDDFSLSPSELNGDKIKLEWKHVGTDAYFSAASLSDGTLRFIALATLLLQPSALRPSVILIDEPELGLHPYALGILAAMIRSAGRGSQIIVSTQSALFLDYFEPKDVLVADRVDGATIFNRLDDERLSSWLEEYSLGQLWEKAEIGGRPR
ncbi:AAA family ATPase [Sphingopyxis sp.]|uniref:AAA family ATPase n=1 Tax=Sphingopyxis sp. TaxID=1908224 RepID=UPI003D13F291